MAMQVGQTGRNGGGRRGRARPMSEINVTPFVDVVLILLIIFVVAAPMLTVGVPVELPRSSADSLPAEAEPPLIITLTREGGVSIQDTEVAREGLVAQLRAIAAERRDDRVYLRADGAVAYAAVMEVMGALNAGGFRNISLVTESGGPRLDGSGE